MVQLSQGVIMSGSPFDHSDMLIAILSSLLIHCELIHCFDQINLIIY